MLLFVGIHPVAGNYIPTIGASPCDIDIDFDYEIQGTDVVFTAKTSDMQNTDIYRWDFGDNTRSEGLRTKKAFHHSGDYKVCLTVFRVDADSEDRVCSKSICKIVKISGDDDPCDIRAAFKIDISNGTVVFHASSNNPQNTDRYIWEFDDNTRASGAITKKEYRKNGEYKVCLTVIRPTNDTDNQVCSNRICKTFKITDLDDPCDIIVDFKYEITGGKVRFVAGGRDMQNTDQYIWEFGDGTRAKGIEAFKEYRKNGVYRVCLTVIRPVKDQDRLACSKTICKVIRITDAPDDCNIKLDFKLDISGDILYGEARSSASSNAKYLWEISDGTRGEGQAFKHQFRSNGIYKVCVTVIERQTVTSITQNCSATVCKRVVIGDPILETDCPIKVDFQYTEGRGGVVFQGRSNETDVEYFWEINDANNTRLTGSTINVNLAPGTYTVCLIAVSKSHDCRQRICKRVTIGKTDGRISPVPAYDIINVHSDKEIDSYKFFGASQNPIHEGVVNSTATTIDISTLRTGVYYLLLFYADGSTSMDKIIKL